MQLYTKVGDKGTTKLVGGGTVSKDSDRVWAYGTIDELNTFIGLAATKLDSKEQDIQAELLQLQHCLFDFGSDLANPNLNDDTMRFNPKYVGWLESKIDQYQDEPPAIQRFILPGGSEQSALFQVCRTITRRAERQIVSLNWSVTLPSEMLKFINRLSDYFYALARVVNYRQGTPEVFYEHGGQVFH
ncbi:cob(I)yrinic acid a,c-diamide adenosyltransferase [Secundilactobacillus muriivasis]